MAEGGDLYSEWLSFSKEQEHACKWRAENALCNLMLKHPESVRLKPIMAELAQDETIPIDYTKSFEEIYEKLYFAARVLYRERSKR